MLGNKGIVIVLLAMAIGVVGFFLGHQAQASAIDGINDQLVAANSRASQFELLYDDRTRSWRALATQVTNDATIKERLRSTNAALLEEIEDANGTILALTELTAEFEQRLAAGQTTEVVAGEAGALEFDIFSREEWGAGSFLQVAGPVKASPVGAEWDLTISGAFGLTTVVDRRGEADLAVSVSFDNENFRVSELNVINNIFDPLIVPDRSFLGDVWGAIKGELFDLTAWRHRAEGALICILACPKGPS